MTFCIFWNAAAGAAETFSVHASEIYVVDGDTVGIGESRYRLAGIDACEREQWAINASGRQFNCGAAGAGYLQSLLVGEVTILTLGIDRYGRHLAILYSQSGQDINAQMVSSGWAVAYYSDRYSETRHFPGVSVISQNQGAGLWAGEFVIPSQHRKNPDAMSDTQSLSPWSRLFAFILSF